MKKLIIWLAIISLVGTVNAQERQGGGGGNSSSSVNTNAFVASLNGLATNLSMYGTTETASLYDLLGVRRMQIDSIGTLLFDGNGGTRFAATSVSTLVSDANGVDRFVAQPQQTLIVTNTGFLELILMEPAFLSSSPTITPNFRPIPTAHTSMISTATRK